MRKIRSQRVVYPDVEITDIAEEGKGVGKVDNLVLFIPHVVPGDVVDVELLRKKKNFGEGRVQTLKKTSQNRTEPFCKHFGICGGCKWQHMDYDAQLLFKQKTVENTLSRIGKVSLNGLENILASPSTKYYRNKLEYTFSNKSWLSAEDLQAEERIEKQALGFHIPQRFDKILPIQHCYLQADPSNDIRNSVDHFAQEAGISYYDLRQHSGELRNLIIRTTLTGELMVIVVFAYPNPDSVPQIMEFLKEKFPNITSLLYIINQKKNDTIFDQEVHVYAGKDHIMEQMGNLKFKIGPKSFYQTNSKQAHFLYQLAFDFAEFKHSDLVYDLYTGAGTIANFIASHVRKVIGIEYVPSAIEDARINAEINEVSNTQFFAGDMKDVLTTAFIQEQGKPDVIITDPPRAGMHADVVQRLLEIEAKKIVYVSCNVATQARDLALLDSKYRVEKIRPVDMFPQTQHVENVVLLRLKEDGFK